MHGLTDIQSAKRALVIGIGGGGDVVGALAVARYLESLGIEWIVGGVSWERIPIDPLPGPRSLSELVALEPIADFAGLAGRETTTRDGVVFAESHMAKYLGEKTLLVDPNGGPKRVAQSLRVATKTLGADLVVAVDVGGDVLAEGHEPGLASPLCDAIMLAAVASLETEVKCLGAVFGPGCDGELTHPELLGRIAVLASTGGLLEITGTRAELLDELDQVVEQIPTEASAQALRCARGELGPSSIRDGSRPLFLSPLGSLCFYYNPRNALKTTAPLAQQVRDCNSLNEANRLLEQSGVQTELDYELRGRNH